jgi:hypothetical protein
MNTGYRKNGGVMNKKIWLDSLGWGLVLWIIGYILGFVFFFILPTAMIGWAIMPIALIITFWVLLTKVSGTSFRYYLFIACVWTILAVALDFLFIVQLLKPADGYYKLDVLLYYVLTFASPLVVALWKKYK